MHLDRLHLRDVMGHADLQLEFAPGLNVVRGPNEAGKSTLQRAIEFALFRRVTAQGADVDRLRRWGAGEEAAPFIELDFSADDGTAGRLAKSFAGTKGRAELRLGNEVVIDPAEVDRRLVGLTGIPSAKFFRSTAAVHHRELADLDREETTLRDRLQTSVSGGDRGTGGARKKLDDAIRRYATEGPKNPGILKTARERVVGLEAQVRAGEAALARLDAERTALSRARDAHAAAERRAEEDRDRLAAAERAVNVLARMRDGQARYDRHRRAAELSGQIAANEAAHPSPVPLPALRAAVERLRADEADISARRARLAEHTPTAEDATEVRPAPDWRPLAIVGAALLVVGAVLAAARFAAFVGPIVLLAGAALVLLALVRYRRADELQRERALLAREAALSHETRAEIERRLAEAEATRTVELGTIGLVDTAAAEALLTAETDHVAMAGRLTAELYGLFGAEPPAEDFAAERDAAAAETEQCRAALAGMGEIGADPERARARLAAAVQASAAERDRVMRAQSEAEGRVGANDVDAEAIAALTEQLAEARERLAAAERRQRVLRATLAGIDDAEKATMQRVARYLERYMAGDVERLTGGRYRRVRVDEATLTFSVWSPDRRDWVDVDRLSQGTIDQFYLAARLGLVHQVTEGRKPPLIFDDPFLTFDDERARRALEMLRETAQDLQVIYLTTSERYDGIADHVIILPAPTGRDVEAPSPTAVGTT